MLSVEKVREYILKLFCKNPTLGFNYIDWHTENSGECGLTVRIGNQFFDIIIRHSNNKLGE